MVDITTILGTSLDGINKIVLLDFKDKLAANKKEVHQEVFEGKDIFHHVISCDSSNLLDHLEKMKKMNNLDDVLIVCLVQALSMNLKDLAVSLKPFVSTQGTVLKSDLEVSPTELLFDFAGAGLFVNNSKILNNFSPEMLQVHFTKKPYIVRSAQETDFQSVKELDEHSWIENLQYSAEVVRHWVTKR